jgi:excisionase family DNA binding protein
MSDTTTAAQPTGDGSNLRGQYARAKEQAISTGDGSEEAYSCPDEPDADKAGAEPEYLTGKQLAGKLNVSRKAVVKWTAAHRLPCCKMGRVWRYPSNEINKRLLGGQLLSPTTKGK